MSLFIVSNIGTRLAEARKQSDHTQKTLAEAVGATQQIITKIETGDVLNSKYFMPICEELGISYSWLVKGKEESDCAESENPDKFINVALLAADEALKATVALTASRGGVSGKFDYEMFKSAFEVSLRGRLTGDYVTAALKLQKLKKTS